MEALSILFDQKSTPLHDSMSSLEIKFASLYMHVEKEMHHLKSDMDGKFQELGECVEMQESN
eukprot:1199655-Karenia_brevis.AAC.1